MPRIGKSACAALIVSLASVSGVMAAGPDDRVVNLAREGNSAAVQSLLMHGGNANGIAADGSTALHWAAYHGDVKTAEQLLRAGAKPDAATMHGVTPLVVACTNGSVEIARMLLDAGASPTVISGEGEPVLLTAARTGTASLVTLLIAHGADVNVTESWHGQTALMWAAAANSAPAVDALLRAKANLSAKAEGGYTALHYASRSGAVDAARALLGAGADPNMRLDDGTSPLMLATINARYELGALLLDHGADPNDNGRGFTALHQLVWSYHPNVVFNPPGPEKAQREGSLDAMGFATALLDHKADPNARMTKNPTDGYRTSMNRIGATPLMMAARVPDLELMHLLLSRGADPTIKTKDNTTLLMVAAGYGWQAGESPEAKPGAHMEAVKLALQLGGDVWAANDRGYTALHCAVIRESNELIQYLVDLGADLYAETKEEDPRFVGKGKGKTPLGVSQGQMINASVKYYPEQEKFLRGIMGVPSSAAQTAGR